MMDTALTALFRAWATTVITLAMLIAGLALARDWDGAIYVEALQKTLNLDG
jgi:hypothetical protein